MQSFDASSIIHAWEEYPIEQFPGLWEWIGEQISEGNLCISDTALTETKHIVPECGEWLSGQGINVLRLSNDVIQEALRIKKELGIVADNFNPRGVSEHDLLIIATARLNNADLITEEKQQSLPQNLARYKIPAVCSRASVDVRCMSFIGYIKESKVVFR